jgi:hypothetical protein
MVLVAPGVDRAEVECGGNSRDDVLALLRHGTGPRPRFDPGLAGGLRAWLEDAACSVVTARGEDAPPLYLGPRQFFGTTATGEADSFAPPLVTACLVHALFRQIVITGAVRDPLRDGISALSVEPGRAELVRHIASLPPAAREALSTTLAVQVQHLIDVTPQFAPTWLPRTNDRLAIPLAGGRVVLCGVFDLLVGAPVAGTSSLCAVGVTSGGPWARARRVLHYLALLETLRSGHPPFRLALLHAAAGRYGVEDVREEHLGAIVSHLAQRLSEVAEAHG